MRIPAQSSGVTACPLFRSHCCAVVGFAVFPHSQLAAPLRFRRIRSRSVISAATAAAAAAASTSAARSRFITPRCAVALLSLCSADRTHTEHDPRPSHATAAMTHTPMLRSLWRCCLLVIAIGWVHQIAALTFDRAPATAPPASAYSTLVAFPLTRELMSNDDPPTLNAAALLASASSNDSRSTAFVLFGGFTNYRVVTDRVWWILWSDASTGPQPPAPDAGSIPSSLLNVHWRAAAPVGTNPAPRGYHASISLHPLVPHVLLSFGGGDVSQAYASLWAYSLKRNQWSGLGPAPDRNADFSLCKPAISTYQFGGDPASRANTIDQCKPTVAGETQVDGSGCPWPHPRIGMSLTRVGTRAFIFGGIMQHGDNSAELWSVDIDASLLAQMQVQYETVDSAFIYPDPATQPICPVTWKQWSVPGDSTSGKLVSNPSAPAPAARIFHSALAIGGLLLIAGGISDFYDTSKTNTNIWIFDPVANAGGGSWTQMAAAATYTSALHPLDRQFTTLIAVNSRADGLLIAPELAEQINPCTLTLRLDGGSQSTYLSEPHAHVLSAGADACDALGRLNATANWTWAELSPVPFPSGKPYAAESLGTAGAASVAGRHIVQFGGSGYNSGFQANVGVTDLSTGYRSMLPAVAAKVVGNSAIAKACADQTAIDSVRALGTAAGPVAGCAMMWPMPRSAHALAVDPSADNGGRVWMYGGATALDYVSELWMWSARRQAWSYLGGNLTGGFSVDPLWPWFREGQLMYAVNRGSAGTLMLFGGWFSGADDTQSKGQHFGLPPVNRLYEYDLSTGSWINSTDSQRSATVAAAGMNVTAAKLIGARIENGFLFPLYRTGAANVQSADGLTSYLFGGNVEDSTQMRSLLISDLWSLRHSDLTWTQLHESRFDAPFAAKPPDHPVSRIDHTLCLDRGRLILTGGYRDPGPQAASYVALGDIWLFSLSTRVWSSIPMVPTFTARHGHATGMLNHRLYVLHGGDQFQGNLVDNWEVELPAEDGSTNATFNSLLLPGRTSGTTSVPRIYAPGVSLPHLRQIWWFAGITPNSLALSDLHTLSADDAIVNGIVSTNVSSQLKHEVLTSAVDLQALPPIAGITAADQIDFPSIAGALSAFQQLKTGFVRLQIQSDVLEQPGEDYASSLARTAASGDRTMYHIEQLSLTQGVDIRGSSSTAGASRPLLDCAAAGRVLKPCFSVQGTALGLQGVVVHGGNSSSNGGGIMAVGGGVTLRSVRFQGQTAGVSGGIIAVTDSSFNATDSFFTGSSAGFSGSAVYALRSAIWLSNCTFETGNSGDGGAFYLISTSIDVQRVAVRAYSASGHGGALFALDSTVQLTDTTLSGHSAGLSGGAVYLLRSSVSLLRSTVSFCTAAVIGGALSGLSSSLSSTSSLFASNHASQGGAIGVDVVTFDSFAGELLQLLHAFELIDCSFVSNSATQGGALFLDQLFFNLNSREPSITGGFFSNNVATSAGGAIYLRRSKLTVVASTFLGNRCELGGGGVLFREYASDLDPQLQLAPRFINGTQTDMQIAGANSAVYGAFLASPPVNYRITLGSAVRGNLTTGIEQASGAVISPAFTISLFDFYSQLVVTDNATFFVMEPSVFLTGATGVRVSRGVATFDGVVLLLPPTQLAAFTFTPSIVLPLLALRASSANPSSLLIHSAICQPGTFNDGQQCVPCARGQFSTRQMATTCDLCPSGSYANATGMSFCFLCDVGTATAVLGSGSACPYCPIGQFSFSTGQTNCAPCANGIECGAGSATATEGRWMVNDPTGQVQSIGTTQGGTTPTAAVSPYTVPCPWENCAANGRCGSNRVNPPALNPLCNKCLDGFHEVSHSCIECPSTNGGRVFLVFLVSFGLVVLLHRLARGSVGESEIVFYFIQSVNFQTGGANTYMSWVAFLDLAPSTATGGVCVIPLSNYAEAGLDLFSPFLLLSMLALLFSLHWLLVRTRAGQIMCSGATFAGRWFGFTPRPRPFKLRRGAITNQPYPTEKQLQAALAASKSDEAAVAGMWLGFAYGPYVRTTLSIYLFSYQQATRVVLSHLVCVDTGAGSLVFVNPSMDCGSSEYKRWQALWIVFLIVWVIGGPLAILIFLHRNRANIKAGNTKLADYLGNLYQGYSPRCYGWVSFVLFRRLVAIALDVSLQTHLAIKIVCFTCWNICMFSAHLYMEPYQSPANHRFGTISLASLCVISTLLMLGVDNNRTTLLLPPSVGVLICVLFFGPLAWMLYKIIRTRWHLARGQRIESGEMHALDRMQSMRQMSMKQLGGSGLEGTDASSGVQMARMQSMRSLPTYAMPKPVFEHVERWDDKLQLPPSGPPDASHFPRTPHDGEPAAHDDEHIPRRSNATTPATRESLAEPAESCVYRPRTSAALSPVAVSPASPSAADFTPIVVSSASPHPPMSRLQSHSPPAAGAARSKPPPVRSHPASAHWQRSMRHVAALMAQSSPQSTAGDAPASSPFPVQSPVTLHPYSATRTSSSSDAPPPGTVQL